MVGLYDYMLYRCICPGKIYVLGMRTTGGVEVDSFPVTVHNVLNQALSIANNKGQYIAIWNSDEENRDTGVLSGADGPFLFSLQVRPGADIPSWVIGNPIGGGSEGGLITEDGQDIISEDGQSIIVE